jgi:cytochrome c-type biogenesis protein
VTGLLALAFGAGLLAPVNPCGFGLLPAMLTATLGHPTGADPAAGGHRGAVDRRSLVARLGGGLRAGLALALGFTATFTVIGLGLTAGVRSLITVVPWLAAALGLVLVLVGLALLAGRHLPLRLTTRHPDHTGVGTGTGRIVAFGAGYAIASAACTLAVLLAVVTQAAATTLVGAFAVFAAYAAGSALLLITLALLAPVAGHTLARALHRSARYTSRIAGALLALSGGYLLFYWLPPLLGTTGPGDAGLTAAALVLTAATAVIRTGAPRPATQPRPAPIAAHPPTARSSPSALTLDATRQHWHADQQRPEVQPGSHVQVAE